MLKSLETCERGGRMLPVPTVGVILCIDISISNISLSSIMNPSYMCISVQDQGMQVTFLRHMAF